MILIASICARISLSPDNCKRVVKYQFSQPLFYSGLESVAKTVFSFETDLGKKSIQSYQTVAVIWGS